SPLVRAGSNQRVSAPSRSVLWPGVAPRLQFLYRGGSMRKYAMLALIALLPPALSAARVSLRDGAVVNGQFISGNSQEVGFQDYKGVRRRFNLNQILNTDSSNISDAVSRNNSANRMDERRRGNDWAVLPAGTSISVRTNETISPENAAEGSTFPAS